MSEITINKENAKSIFTALLNGHDGLIIKPNNDVVYTTASDKKKGFSCGELHTIVNGYFEIVPIQGTELIAVCDEEGKLKEKPINHVASLLIDNDYFVGDILICHNSMVK